MGRERKTLDARRCLRFGFVGEGRKVGSRETGDRSRKTEVGSRKSGVGSWESLVISHWSIVISQ
jgi:hypothetical protein